VSLPVFLQTVKGNIIEKDIVIGAKDQGEARLIASVFQRQVSMNAEKSQEEREEERLYSLPSSPDSVSMESLYHECTADHMED